MTIREALVADIPAIMEIRFSVRENVLNDRTLVSDEDCVDYLTRRGKGWVCEVENEIVGFAIADLEDENIWALFIHPDFEKRGIGRLLHQQMLDWYFDQNKEYVWLGTTPGTRAEGFYRKAGWTENGMHGADEIKFEMTKERWINSQ